jgi:hypothetical protein
MCVFHCAHAPRFQRQRAAAAAGVIRMNRAKDLSVYGGAVVLAVLCSSVRWSGVMTPWAPWPVYQVLLAWTTGIGLLLVMPAIYVGTALWLWDSPNRGRKVLWVSVAFALLSVVYLANAWDVGARFQGATHTRIVVEENAVGLIVVLFLAVIGLRPRAQQSQIAALFLVFAMLSWCAFPYLGELP